MIMKKYFVLLVSAVAFVSCQKEKEHAESVEDGTTTTATVNAAAVCTNGQYALSLDATGRGRFFKVTATPSAGTASYVAVNGTCGNNIINGANIAQVLKPTGLALASGGTTALVTTGVNGVAPNRLYKFPIGNPCSPTSIALIPPAGLSLNVSDLERNPSNGNYYAINTDPAGGANEVVQVNVATGAVTRLTSGSMGVLQLRGLTFLCDPAYPNAFVYQDNGVTGNIYEIDIVTGSIVSGPLVYGGPVNPTGMVDMGLTADCVCTDYFMTCNGTPGTLVNPTFTAGMPVAFGGAYAASSTNTLRPTVDFGKW